MFFSSLLPYTALFHLSIAGYVLQDDYMKDFYSQFEFFTEADPTKGHVKFVDEATAKSSGLINSSYTGAVSWGVDTTNITPEGRPSIRLTSHKSYSSGLIVLDVEHMPAGCGTWPAFWTVGPSWPQNGEIDILEGVNEQAANSFALHTAEGCSISQNSGSAFSGDLSTPNCDVNASGQGKNVGCAIKSKDTQTYGEGLNSNKGGIYATLWTGEAISMFFFPRGQVPQDVLGESPDPSTWGTPAATFSGGCDIPSFFKDNQIVFDTTFCGDWAGNDFTQGSCKSKAATCQEYVTNNPKAFAEAYWTINGLKVYQQDGSGSPAPPSGQPSSAVSSTTVGSATPTPLPTTFSTTVRHSAGTGASSGFTSTLPSTRNFTLPTTGIPIAPSIVPTSLAATSAPSSARFTAPAHTAPAHTGAPAPSGPMPGFGWPGKGNGKGKTPRAPAMAGQDAPPAATTGFGPAWARHVVRRGFALLE
jgi:hypothetical protein